MRSRSDGAELKQQVKDGETLDGDAILIGTLSVDAVLFDLDGTLVDSLPDLLEAVNRLLMAMKRRTLTLAEATAMVGDGAPRLLERALAATGAPPSPEALPDLVQRFTKLYKSGASNRSVLYPDALAVVQALRRCGIKLGVVTNKPMAATREVLRHFELDTELDVVIGGDSLAERKPSGLPVVTALRRLGVAADRAAMVGDMANDLKAAKAGGARPILVTYGYAQRSPKALGAREWIDRLRDLPDVLAGSAPPDTWAARTLKAIDQRRHLIGTTEANDPQPRRHLGDPDDTLDRKV